MNYSKWEYQNIALAAVAQSAALVERLATHGEVDAVSIRVCTAPLLNFSPASISDLYPNIAQLSIGLRTLQDIFGIEKTQKNSEVIRYILGILALRQKLMSDKAMQGNLQGALRKINPKIESKSEDADEKINKLYHEIALVYQETISTYAFRVHVKGNLEYLKDEVIADKIRALLLAGIRAAVLWYQIGGRRWHLILYRKKICLTCRQIRKSLITTV